MSQLFKTRSTGGPIVWDKFENVIYVAKGGDDANDGKNLQEPKLTFGAAITAATAETPSVTDPYTIVCLDAGIYVENITTLPSFCAIHAPNATLEGYIHIPENSNVDIRVIDAAGLAPPFTSAVVFLGEGESSLKVGELIADSILNGIYVNAGTAAGYVYIDFDTISVENGAGIYHRSFFTIPQVLGKKIIVSGTGEAINAFKINAEIVSLVDTGGAGSGINATVDHGLLNVSCQSIKGFHTGIYARGTTQPVYVNAIVNELSSTYAYDCSVNGRMKLTVNSLTGIQDVTPDSANIYLNRGINTFPLTVATKTIAPYDDYIINRAAGVTLTLPASAVIGDVFSIAGKAGLWSIAQNANQQILVGNASSTVGIGGSLTATNVGDCIRLVCITGGASSFWRATSTMGNITIV